MCVTTAPARGRRTITALPAPPVEHSATDRTAAPRPAVTGATTPTVELCRAATIRPARSRPRIPAPPARDAARAAGPGAEAPATPATIIRARRPAKETTRARPAVAIRCLRAEAETPRAPRSAITRARPTTARAPRPVAAPWETTFCSPHRRLRKGLLQVAATPVPSAQARAVGLAATAPARATGVTSAATPPRRRKAGAPAAARADRDTARTTCQRLHPASGARIGTTIRPWSGSASGGS